MPVSANGRPLVMLRVGSTCMSMSNLVRERSNDSVKSHLEGRDGDESNEGDQSTKTRE
jgi:hypothetical protein